MVNPQPGYRLDLTAWARGTGLLAGPRKISRSLPVAAITTIPPNIWQDNSLTGATPLCGLSPVDRGSGAPVRSACRSRPKNCRKYSLRPAQIFCRSKFKDCATKHGDGRKSLRARDRGPQRERSNHATQYEHRLTRLRERLSGYMDVWVGEALRQLGRECGLHRNRRHFPSRDQLP